MRVALQLLEVFTNGFYMTKRDEFGAWLDGVYSPREYRDFCFNGLQVEGTGTLNRVGFAVSASEATLNKAADLKLDGLVVHHGFFWDQKGYHCTGATCRKLKLLLDCGINLWGYHLPMDAHRELGNNWCVADQLGLTQCSGFYQVNGRDIGVKGRLPEKVSHIKMWRDLVEKIITVYELDKLKINSMSLESLMEGSCEERGAGSPSAKQAATSLFWAGEFERPIESVAIVSGGSHRALTDAIASGVDLFITGSRDEPQWHLARESGVIFAPVGHSVSERIGPRALMEYAANCWNIEVVWIEDLNPY